MADDLYSVTFEVEALVVASSPEEAKKKLLEENWPRDDLSIHEEYAMEARLSNGIIPSNWDEDCLVYGIDGDVTVAQAIERYCPDELA